tara:strand:- start:752 stop:1288 length:537 start_codon:yes stop_codon:yes gene_type:complete
MKKRPIIDYADLPRSEWPGIVPRKEALELGVKSYFTGKLCKWGHRSERYSSGGCAICMRLRGGAYGKTPEAKAKARARSKDYHQTPEAKARMQTPEYKANKASYNRSPRYKEYLREHRENPEVRSKIKAYQHSEAGTRTELKCQLGFDPPEEYVKSIYQQRLLKRELRKLKEKQQPKL